MNNLDNVINNSLDKQYQDLLQDILDNGVVKGDRTGTGTISVFGRQIRHNMKDGFPLLTTKKMPFKTIATELIWFLKGDTNIKFLVDNGCNIWNGDALKNFNKSIDEENNREIAKDPFAMHQPKARWSEEEFVNKIKTDDAFAKKWGELGPVYGKQWRNWEVLREELWHTCGSSKMRTTHKRVDQIYNLVKDLKENPDSRRLMVNAWNVAEIDQMVLPPCHYGFQLYTRELTLEERNYSLGPWNAYLGIFGYSEEDDLEYKELFDSQNRPTRAISLMWNQRSVDTFLGLPFNIASYGLLLEILAKEVNMVPDQLIGNLGDTHLYSNHLEQAKEQIERESFNLPSIEINDTWKFGSSSPVFADKLKLDMFTLVKYVSHGAIKAPLSN